jgi:hypothetical protein
MKNDANQAAEIEQERKEECRRRVREHLANRPGIALHPRIIQRRMNEGKAADFDEEEVRAALLFLAGAAQVAEEHDALGATKTYKITSAGTLAHERGQ